MSGKVVYRGMEMSGLCRMFGEVGDSSEETVV